MNNLDDLINLFDVLDPGDMDSFNAECQNADAEIQGPALRQKPDGFNVKEYADEISALDKTDLMTFCERASHHDPTRVVRPKS